MPKKAPKMISMTETRKTSSPIMFTAAGNCLFMAFACLLKVPLPNLLHVPERKVISAGQIQAVARSEEVPGRGRMKSVLYRRLEFIKSKRLGKTNVGARIFHFFQGGQIAAHANDMNVRTLRFQELAELYSVHSRHVGVCHDNVVSALLEKPDGLEPIARFIDPMAEKGYH
jgi:hypothetical protein